MRVVSPLASLALLACVFAAVTDVHHHKHLLMARSDSVDAKCLNGLADYVWHQRPTTATAAICYSSKDKYTVASKAPESFQEGPDHECNLTTWYEKLTHKIKTRKYNCLYLLGTNSFTYKGLGWAEVLMIRHDGCKWDKKSKTLPCTARPYNKNAPGDAPQLNQRSEIPSLEKRDNGLRECLSKHADETWANRPPGTTAAGCYADKYKMDNLKTGWKKASSPTCTDKEWYGKWTIKYECFWMLGSNTFYALGDGGDDNLALRHQGCQWDSGKKTLQCK